MTTLQPPIEPMLAKIADELPHEAGFLFEPKWDGFRAIVFRGGDEAYIQSRDLRPLNRYFPGAGARRWPQALPKGCVIDGEIVVVTAPTASISTRCSSACIPPPRGWRGSRRKRRLPSSPSTCWPRAAARPWSCRKSERRVRLERLLGQAPSRRCT